MFPYINHISDLLKFIQHNPQFRVAVQPNGTTVVCYMLQDEDTFKGESDLHASYAKECRGITFDADGNVIARTLHKFQNVGENDETQPDQIPWNKITRIMDKRDGSMITPVLVDGKVQCKTKKTFTSNEALAAQEFLEAVPQRVEWVAAMLKNGMTVTFEWTSPRFPIVLLYTEDALTILQVRENKTGRYLSEAEIKFLLPMRNPKLFPIVENIIDEFRNQPYMEMGCFADDIVNWDYNEKGLKHAAETRTGIEGWIIQADDGQMWKVKTKWYIALHHSVTFTRWRDIARDVVADKSDDLKAAFAMTGRDIAPIIEVEKKINAVLLEVETKVNAEVAAAHAAGLNAKDLALSMQQGTRHEYFGFIMSAFRGNTPNYRDWYLKERIRDWNLQVIVQNEDIEVPETEEEA